ncbi:MAG: hypothetical protein QW625_02810 [Candidatus Nanoarchaeia archaeon]
MKKNKKQKEVNKRGLTVQSMLIGIIIVVIGAAIIFLFIKSLPYKETVDKEACHQSVILRSQAIAGLQPGQLLNIPLNCKTQEITISSTNEDFIKREIANSMYDCWWMLGEGKMKFWSESTAKEFGLGNVKSTCIICSIIRFDKSVKAKNLRLDMASYMEQTKIPNKNVTYLEYFTDETGTKLPTDVQAPPITTDSDYVILFMGIEGDELWEPIVKDLGVVAGSLVGTTALFGPRATGSLLKGVGGLMSKGFDIGTKTVPGMGFKATKTIPALTIKLGWVGLLVGAAFVATQTIWTANNQAIVMQRCDGERKGCMQVMLLPMDASTIGQVCSNIESIP